MTASEQHPSFFQLDMVAVGSDSIQTSVTQKHLADCAQCKAYLSGLAAPIPPRQTHIAAPARPWYTKTLSTLNGFFQVRRVAAVGGLGLFTLLLFGVQSILIPGQSREQRASHSEVWSGIRTKGLPSVTLFHEHKGEITQWSPLIPVSPGDRIAIRLEGPAQSFVVVGSGAKGSDVVTTLYQMGPISETPFDLPFSLLIDDSPGSNKLLILFPENEAAYHEFLREPATAPLWRSYGTVFEFNLNRLQ